MEMKRMDPTRRTAVAVAVLFIVATVVFSIGQAAHGAILSDPDYLDLASRSAGRIAVGTLVEFVGVLAIPLTAVFLFPLLKGYSEALALTYVALRILEAVPLFLVEAAIFATLTVSQSSSVPGAAVDWHTAGAAIQAFREATFFMSIGLLFPIGCFLLNSLLLKTRLVPRWIAIWGLAAAILILVGSVSVRLGMFADVSPAVLEAAIAGPVAIQEMVFALWLIAKGFNRDASERLLVAAR